MSNMIQGLPAITPEQNAANIAAPASEGSSFMDTLRNVMDQMGQLQTDAQQQVSSLLHGDGEDVHTAMIAMQKADLSFQLMMQARNKIIDAYQQVSQMQF